MWTGLILLRDKTSGGFGEMWAIPGPVKKTLFFQEGLCSI
jgi:hypothetical protein